ncbi:MAG: hypothetical protein GY869_07540, partial [Planctomycetes bacterium]|nr:hypothetical protein [Planctomycetota bacterium]
MLKTSKARVYHPESGRAVPLNDLCGAAEIVNVGDTIIGVTDEATDTDAPGSCGDSDADYPGVWFTISSAGDEIILISTDNAGTDFDTRLAGFSGACGALTCVDGNDDGSQNIASYSSDLQLLAASPTTFFIYLDGYGGAVGNFELTISSMPIPFNMVCSGAAGGALPFCTDSPIVFPAGVNTGVAEIGPDYDCLSDQPNPAWF